MNKKFSSPFVVACLLYALASRASAETQESIWFDDIKERISLQEVEAKVLLAYIFQALVPAPEDTPALPDEMQRKSGPCIVFLSLSDGAAKAEVVMGTGRGVPAAIDSALRSFREKHAIARPSWVKLDIVQSVGRPASLTAKLRPGLDGVALSRSTGLALLPEQILHEGMINEHGDVRPNGWNRVLSQLAAARSIKANLQHFRRFSTQSFFSDGQQVVRLYRGHRLTSGPNRKDLLDSVWSGGEYLCRAVDESGRFAYLYYPDHDRVPRDYNLVRHAGTIYSMLDVYQTTKDPDLLESADRAIAFLLERVKPYRGREDVACVADGKKISLGGVSLAVVALAKHVEATGDCKHLPVLEKLGKYIQVSQRSSGKFINRRRYPSGAIWDIDSAYFPGEAILALVRLHGIDGNETWLDTAEKGARYLIEVRDRDAVELLHDHWLLYALNDLHRYRPRRLYLEHSLRIARGIGEKQHRDVSTLDRVGSYYDPPRTCPAATRTEGLAAAYELARRAGRNRDARALLETLALNVAFQLRTQAMPETALYCKDPKRCLGGFHSSLTDHEIRIDYVQHNISGFVCLYRLLETEGREALAEPSSSSHRLLSLVRKRAFR